MSNSHETTCALLLTELQKIWNEVGEADDEKEKMLFQIEQECMEVYRRKIGDASKWKARLQREVALAESEIASICSALGEQPPLRGKRVYVNLKEEVQGVSPLLEEMRRRREERKRLFVDVVDGLRDLSFEIFGSAEDDMCRLVVEGADLSVKKLEELQRRLCELQDEKSRRLRQVVGHVETLKSLCGVLGMDLKRTLHEIHPTLDDSYGAKDLTDDTIKRLVTAIENLRQVKMHRIDKLQDLATSLLELWDLMDTPLEEQQMFHKVTQHVAASESEFTEPNMLSEDIISHVKEEVSRLEQLKSSKVKEIVLKKRIELEEICKKTHMVIDTLLDGRYSIEAVGSGEMDPIHLLEDIDLEIVKAKEVAFSRKDILDKVEKWLSACEEECWLEEYNRDDNRYNAGRGAHLILKRAEKARAVVNKIPAIVETLTSKITAWEEEKGKHFVFDGGRLLSRLEDYNDLRQAKELERLRQRDQKKSQVQRITEQEARFGSKPSPLQSAKKISRPSIGGASNRKLSLGGGMLQNLKAEKPSPLVQPNRKGAFSNQNSSLRYQQYGCAAPQSSGRRCSEIPGPFAKKQSFTTAKEGLTESRFARKPLSPVPLTMSSNVNIANFLEDQKTTQSDEPKLLIKAPAGSPSNLISTGDIKNQMITPARGPKTNCIADGENRTPERMPIPVPATPLTSAPMMVAFTPATPHVRAMKNITERVEYSFEEVRAGFICLRS
ncbi:hypothetical protein Tsubulata_038463 [Turnera subulata]|uniref:65-kDa microtubule-associated protein 3 n=1 Tax=Turnera subulata TaxID=218843 RepID=A0A9Q0G7M9_9ROSI|nr:hypothetical protein Tsubulata_038463 [Turnera subulata]